GNSKVKSRTRSAVPVAMNSSVRALTMGRTMLGAQRARACVLNAAELGLRCARGVPPSIARRGGPVQSATVVSYNAERNTPPSRRTRLTASNDIAAYPSVGRSDSGVLE